MSVDLHATFPTLGLLAFAVSGCATKTLSEVMGSDSDAGSQNSPDMSGPRLDRGTERDDAGVTIDECAGWHTTHPEWVFCDDFESQTPLTGAGGYFESNYSQMPGAGLTGSGGMKIVWQEGLVNAAVMRLSFGRNAISYMDTGIRNTEDFDEIYARAYMKLQDGWVGSPDHQIWDVSVFTGAGWGQAMSTHLVFNPGGTLGLQTYTCVYPDGSVPCSVLQESGTWLDLGTSLGTAEVHSEGAVGVWRCLEMHVRLNTPGQSDGFEELWIDGILDVSRQDIDHVGEYADYRINTFFMYGFWTSGAPQAQEQYFDNLVVSTERIGCFQ